MMRRPMLARVNGLLVAQIRRRNGPMLRIASKRSRNEGRLSARGGLRGEADAVLRLDMRVLCTCRRGCVSAVQTACPVSATTMPPGGRHHRSGHAGVRLLQPQLGIAREGFHADFAIAAAVAVLEVRSGTVLGLDDAGIRRAQ